MDWRTRVYVNRGRLLLTVVSFSRKGQSLLSIIKLYNLYYRHAVCFMVVTEPGGLSTLGKATKMHRQKRAIKL